MTINRFIDGVNFDRQFVSEIWLRAQSLIIAIDAQDDVVQKLFLPPRHLIPRNIGPYRPQIHRADLNFLALFIVSSNHKIRVVQIRSIAHHDNLIQNQDFGRRKI